MTWPSLPGFAPTASFVDHFDAASLDARWTSVTSGTGAVSITDSYVEMNQPANSASFIYYNTQLDKTKSQMWLAAVSQQTLDTSSFAPRLWHLVNGASAPIADTKTNIDGKTVFERFWGGNGIRFQYYDNSTGVWDWSSSGAGGSDTFVSAGSAVGTDVDTVARADDYYVIGLEIDGPNSRWREMVWGATFATAGTYQFDQGWRFFALSDWVNWSATRTSTNLWFCLGQLYNNSTAVNKTRVEWVRYIEARPGNGVVDAFAAAEKDSTQPGVLEHRIRHYYSLDGQTFVPQDRATWALALGSAGQFDQANVQEPWCVFDGSVTDYLFYSGNDSAVNAGIGVATATHATPQNNAFTRFGSNPIITLGSSGANDDSVVGFCCVVMDTLESDVNKRWKMLYSGKKTSDSKWRTLYATAASPTSTWTKQGTVIDVGGGGSADETAARDAVIVNHQGLWYVFYHGWNASGVNAIMWATGSDLGNLTKKGTLFTMPIASSSADKALTANLSTAPGRTVTVSDTTGFVKDAPVIVDQDNNNDNWGYSRIRKIASSTQIELYHGLTGFTTTTPARIKQIDSEVNIQLRTCVRVGSEWWFYLGIWEPFFNSGDGASYFALLEEMWFSKHASAGPTDTAPTVDYLASPMLSRGFNNDLRSLENMTLVVPPFVPDMVPAPLTRLPNWKVGPMALRHQLRRSYVGQDLEISADVTIAVGAATATGVTPAAVVLATVVETPAIGLGQTPAPALLATSSPAAAPGLGQTPVPVVRVDAVLTAATALGIANAPALSATSAPAAATAAGSTPAPTVFVTVLTTASLATGSTPAPNVVIGQFVFPPPAVALGQTPAPTVLATVAKTAATAAGVAPSPSVTLTLLPGPAVAGGVVPAPALFSLLTRTAVVAAGATPSPVEIVRALVSAASAAGATIAPTILAGDAFPGSVTITTSGGAILVIADVPGQSVAIDDPTGSGGVTITDGL